MKQFLVYILLVTFFNGIVFGQNDKEICFDVDRILPVRYEPSGIKRISDSNIDNLVFEVRESQSSETLTNRLISLLIPTKDSLTIEDHKKIDYASKKFRISRFANYTDSTILIPRILNRITLLQEALDEDGIWRPIESSDDNLFCGNTDHGLIELKSGESIEIYIRKYCGEFQTKLRMKLLTKNEVFVSEEYVGYVNLEQFDLDSISDKKNVYFINSSVEDERNRVLKIKNELKQK